jgi:hypothetical protein
VTLDRPLAAAARDLGRSLAQLRDQPFHQLAATRENLRIAFHL